MVVVVLHMIVFEIEIVVVEFLIAINLKRIQVFKGTETTTKTQIVPISISDIGYRISVIMNCRNERSNHI